MKLIALSFLLIISSIPAPTRAENPPRLGILVLMSPSTQTDDPKDLLIKILKRQVWSVHVNAKRALSQQAAFLLKINIDSRAAVLSSPEAYYDVWRNQKLLEIMEPSIYKPPGSKQYKAKTQMFLGDLTNKYEGKYLESSSIIVDIEITPDRLSQTVDVHQSILLLALLLDSIERKASPEIASYLIKEIVNTLADLRKDQKAAEVHKLTEQISSIVEDVKNVVRTASSQSGK
jgi:hypothetical protein